MTWLVLLKTIAWEMFGMSWVSCLTRAYVNKACSRVGQTMKRPEKLRCLKLTLCKILIADKIAEKVFPFPNGATVRASLPFYKCDAKEENKKG